MSAPDSVPLPDDIVDDDEKLCEHIANQVCLIFVCPCLEACSTTTLTHCCFQFGQSFSASASVISNFTSVVVHFKEPKSKDSVVVFRPRKDQQVFWCVRVWRKGTGNNDKVPPLWDRTAGAGAYAGLNPAGRRGMSRSHGKAPHLPAYEGCLARAMVGQKNGFSAIRSTISSKTFCLILSHSWGRKEAAHFIIASGFKPQSL